MIPAEATRVERRHAIRQTLVLALRHRRETPTVADVERLQPLTHNPVRCELNNDGPTRCPLARDPLHMRGMDAHHGVKIRQDASQMRFDLLRQASIAADGTRWI